MSEWGHLINHLRGYATVSEKDAGRIHVVFHDARGKRRSADILMTKQEWSSMAGTMWGDVDRAVQEVRRALMRLGGERYLIYGQYELVPSFTPEMPESELGGD
ncbi:hypothetical protein [Solicola sp. PLA-1-18]|uniref:hypothetical protein n=1 Tax=Solicola sp. PLA-1-18 TaxID=3380532 RepID=UPI003B80E2B6